MEKLVTVIMPVYNTGLRLKESVNSVLQSSYRNIEFLIVDDGSEKETAELCDMLGKKDDRIKVIHQKNGGVSAARNTGLKHAKGDYITFVDSDDFLEANMISALTDIAERENVLRNCCNVTFTAVPCFFAIIKLPTPWQGVCFVSVSKKVKMGVVKRSSWLQLVFRQFRPFTWSIS
jgi:glycosyltransferase involved in cell wall biosynthesis